MTQSAYYSLLAFVHEDIGGYEGLVDKYFLATASIRASTTPNGTELCGEVPGDAMHLLRDATPGSLLKIFRVCSYLLLISR